MSAVAVGLVGGGPWAEMVHAPMLAAGPETRLAGIWTRRGTSPLGERYGVPVTGSFNELLDSCEAVAFAVPPDVQASLATLAAQAGKALLLEKPVALTLAGAEILAAAVDKAEVVSQVVFTKRYHQQTRDFLAAAADFPTAGARACYVHGAFLGGPFATAWRLEHGALLDLGPHTFDLLDAAVGPIESIRATGDPRRWVELTCVHANGAISQMSLSGSVPVPQAVTTVELYGTDGVLSYDTAGMDHDECWPVVRREFAAAVRSGTPHELDVHRGVMIQRLLAAAECTVVI
jgi:predicted dehydrogenase